MGEPLFAWIEIEGDYHLAGRIDEGAFRYDDAYIESGFAPISVKLPFSDRPFSEKATQAFFGNIVPEGDQGTAERRIARSGFSGVLSHLHDETAGALMFSRGDAGNGFGAPTFDDRESYAPAEKDIFEQLSKHPVETAVKYSGKTHRSVAGAMPKITLYRDGSGHWFTPQGLAPSNVIVKTPANKLFPGEAINEFICMRAASIIGLNVARVSLIPVEDEDNPLLAVERFDRSFDGALPSVNGLPRPFRLHQEDMCQALGFPASWKYEPTDGNYLSLVDEAVHTYSSAPAEDEDELTFAEMFNLAIGNCDNHLKNHALLYSPDMRTIRLAPLYDCACTAIYPEIYRKMGIALSKSRTIDSVTLDDVRRAGLMDLATDEAAPNYLARIADNIEKAIGQAEYDAQEFAPRNAVLDVSDKIKKDAVNRLERILGNTYWNRQISSFGGRAPSIET